MNEMTREKKTDTGDVLFPWEAAFPERSTESSAKEKRISSFGFVRDISEGGGSNGKILPKARGILSFEWTIRKSMSGRGE